MEDGTFNKDQEIAGSAAALFGDSSSPFDTLLSNQQDNQSAALFFESLANEQPSQIQQTTTTDYSQYYGYDHNSGTLQEATYGTVTNATDTQQFNSTTNYDYNYYGQYDTTNTNGITGETNSYYTGYSYDTSYTNGQDYSQYYDYSQQPQYYDPNDPNGYYYNHDPSTYYQVENNIQSHTQGSINVEQQQNSFQELPDQVNSIQYEEQREEDTQNNIQLNNNEVDESMTYDESKKSINDALKPDGELVDVPSITDVDNSKNDNKNRELSLDSDKEDKEMSREIDPTRKKSIEEQDTVSTLKFQDLTISSSSSLNNEDIAAVALVETIETNQESAQFTASSTEIENNYSSIEKDNELNNLGNEDQEVNIIHGNDHDIFEYQPQELESHPKSELSQAEQPVSSLLDESKITSEISAANETEEIDKSKDESTKLDDLDDLVLGSTIKSGTTEVFESKSVANTQESHSISTQDNDSKDLNSSYQYDYSGQDYQYNEQWVPNDASYQYQEYYTNQTTGDTTTSIEQVSYQYQENDANQTTRNITTANYQHDADKLTDDTTVKEQSTYQYSSQTEVDNITDTNQTISQYSASQTTVENSPSTYHHSGYEANQSTSADADQYRGYDGQEQSNYQYQGYNTTAEQEQSSYQYQVYETGQAATDNKDVIDQTNYQYMGYDTNQVNYQDAEQTNYQYQEYETRQVDTNAGTDLSNYQYYQGYQSVTNPHSIQNSPPPISPQGLISCPDPQCGGENKATAKFCSDCGKSINNVTRSTAPTINITETTNIYSNNLNAYSGQSLPYNNSQASYSAQSFASYAERDPGAVLDTQQQYYGTDDVNDFLGRSKGCRPIVAFGFGGKIYTMFPRTVQRFTSTDQSTPITKSAPGAFTVRVLKDIIPISDIDDFPGPLFRDNNKGGVKAKKKSVLKYIDDRIQALENNINSFDGGIEKNENVLIVWNLFKIMFENEGTLIGSPKVEELVRKVLVPSAFKSDNDQENFTVPADTGFNTQNGLPQTSETSSFTYSVSTKAVDELQELLLKGDRVAAIHHAMNENLWAHALIIASCVNKDLWKEVVTGFVKYEMGTPKGDISESNGRESLRVLYSLFAGQGQNAVKEFLPYSNLLSPATAMVPTTPYIPNPNVPYVTSNVITSSSDHNASLDSLIKWRETIAMILANRAPGDSQAIFALGDMLKEYGWIHAAHACYILSPNISIISGLDAPNARFTLFGNDYKHNLSINNFYDWKSLHMTEIYEFGLSLNNDDGGLPHLQAYKLLYAWWLADCGYLNEARRYCESIANIVKVYTKGSPYFHGCFLQKLKDLTQRLLEHGGNNNNESSSWLFAKKMPKATLDSLWGSLEGKFNKFVTGDVTDEGVKSSPSNITPDTIGPFSHFSSISTPEVPSRSVSASDFRSSSNSTANMRRSTTPNVLAQKQLSGNHRRSSTPGVGLVNGGTFSPTTSDNQNIMSSVPEYHGGQNQYSGSYGYNHYDNYQQSATDNGYSNSYGVNSNEQQSTQQLGYNSSLSDHSNAEANNKQQAMYPYYQPLSNNTTTTYKNDSAWWNNPNSDFADTTEGQKADQTQINDTSEGEFISLMDNNFTSFIPAPAPAPITTSKTDTSNYNNNLDDDYEDLGLGNNAFKKNNNDQSTDPVTDTNSDNEAKNTPQTEQKQEEKKEEQKAEEKSGWFGRWFGKKEGGKSANLGEESSFYFDPVQKRWINKKAGAETNNTLTPPPPPPQRSKTTSPMPSRSMMSSNPNRQSLPPMDDKNLTGPPSTPPPPNKGGRASSASMKRNIRSRYVDVMNQQ